MFRLLEETGFEDARSVVVPSFRFKKESTRRTGERYGVKAVLFTATKPA